MSEAGAPSFHVAAGPRRRLRTGALLAGLTALLLAACSGDSSDTDSSDTDRTGPAAPAPSTTEAPADRSSTEEASPTVTPGPTDTGVYFTVTATEHADEARTHVFEHATFGGSADDPESNRAIVRTAPGFYTGAYNVVTRNPDEIFVYHGVYGEQEGATGPAVARLDADTLEEVWNTQLAVYDDNATSWNYPGVVGLHGNGTLIVVSGNTAAVIDPDTGVIVNQVDLPQDDPANGSYNGFITTSDGTLFTKALFRSCDTVGSPALFRCLDTDVTQAMIAIDPVTLEIIDEVELPDFATGRIPVGVHDGVDYIYLPGVSSLYRYRREDETLTLDEDWGFVAVTEDGDLTALTPNLTEDWAFLQVNTGSSKPMPVWAISTSDSSVRHSIQPFDGTPVVASFNAAHGSFDPDNDLLHAADTGASRASALAFDPESGFEVRWVEEQTLSVFQQLVDAPDRRVVVANELIDFEGNPLAAAHEQVVFRNAVTGQELARTEELLPRMSQGANISPGFDGRMYFPGVDGTLYEITVQSD